MESDRRLVRRRSWPACLTVLPPRPKSASVCWFSAMRPILYDFGFDIPFLGPLNFPAYFTMLALSFGLGMWMLW